MAESTDRQKLEKTNTRTRWCMLNTLLRTPTSGVYRPSDQAVITTHCELHYGLRWTGCTRDRAALPGFAQSCWADDPRRRIACYSPIQGRLLVSSSSTPKISTWFYISNNPSHSTIEEQQISQHTCNSPSLQRLTIATPTSDRPPPR